jgi:hypothetical protein
MAHASSARSPYPSSGARTGVRELLFKLDHPRAIDDHIDYFGGATEASSDIDADVCEVMLERPA